MPEMKELNIKFDIDESWNWMDLISQIALHFNVPEILVKALLELNRNSTPHDNNDRTFILNLEEEIISFIKAPNVDSWKMVPLNSYYRLLTHKISEYYQLGHILSNDGFSMVLFKKNTSLINADELTKKNAKIAQSGKVQPLNFEDLNFDPDEKLNRISLKVIYETFHEDVKKLSNDDPNLTESSAQQPKMKILKKNNGNNNNIHHHHHHNNNGNSNRNNNNQYSNNISNGNNSNRNGSDNIQHGKLRNQYKSKGQLHYYPQPNYYYPSPLPQMMTQVSPLPPPGSGNEQEYPQPIYYVPIIPQDNEMYHPQQLLPPSGDGYILYPPPPPKLEEQLQKQRNMNKNDNEEESA